jgi:hypothetical protein
MSECVDAKLQFLSVIGGSGGKGSAKGRCEKPNSENLHRDDNTDDEKRQNKIPFIRGRIAVNGVHIPLRCGLLEHFGPDHQTPKRARIARDGQFKHSERGEELNVGAQRAVNTVSGVN